MYPYLQEIVDEFPYYLEKVVLTPAAPHLFEISEDATPLSDDKRKEFHHAVAKTLCAAICSHPNLLTTLPFLKNAE
jgi:predicted Rdx family selenoprotein